jgi:protein-disulfide isomerase
MKAYARLVFVLALAVGMAGSGVFVSAQSLQQQNDQILQELKAIRQLLEKLAGPLGGQPGGPVPTQAAAPADDRVKLANVVGYAIGQPDAPLTMVEFTDLQCPFCRQFHVTAYEQIKKDYIDTGKLRYISRDFPLDSIHPFALNAAHAARCAADQGKFWEMRHTILLNNAALTNDVFNTFAQDLKLNVPNFKSCEATATTKFQAEMQKDLTDATSVGVSGTPTFVIGRTAAAGLDGVRIVGAQPYSVFDAKLKELLAKPASQ